jgi:hypothetical protein
MIWALNVWPATCHLLLTNSAPKGLMDGDSFLRNWLKNLYLSYINFGAILRKLGFFHYLVGAFFKNWLKNLHLKSHVWAILRKLALFH